MSRIQLKNVSKRWRGFVGVDNINLDVADEEFLVLLGPSGCGKTTTMRMIAGLEDVTEGEIWLGDRMVNRLEPKDRDISMVFQSYGLYPNLTVYENIRFPLRVRKVPREEHDARVRKAASMVELTPFLDRRPAALSGGQRQRVALGRAIVREPNAFLMDEPLSNLDARLRGQMRSEIAKLQRMTAVTTIYVTHDQVEAMTMGDRVAVMNKGTLQQLDTPRALYDRPRNLFVASFIGSPPMNFLRGTVEAGGDGTPGARLGANWLELDARHGQLGQGRPVYLGIRPEAMKLAGDAPGLPAKAAFVEDLGSTLLVHLDSAELDIVPPTVAEDDVDLTVVRPRLRAVTDGNVRIARDDVVRLAVLPQAIHVFDPASGEAL